jgi:hypothetical protein
MRQKKGYFPLLPKLLSTLYTHFKNQKTEVLYTLQRSKNNSVFLTGFSSRNNKISNTSHILGFPKKKDPFYYVEV